MPHSHHWVKITLLALLCHTAPFILHAQDEVRLDKPVKLKITNERLADVLDELARKGYFTFSYKSDILKKDRMVTLTLRESTLREALNLMLGSSYDYAERSDYVIIRRKKANRDAVVPKRRYRDDDSIRPEKGTQPYKRMVLAKKRVHTDWDTVSFEVRKQTVVQIIADMVTDKIVKDKDSFRWFGLDGGQFVVDGKPVADSLRLKFQAKFIKPDGVGYYYGPVSIQGHGFFFDRKDIYVSPQ